MKKSILLAAALLVSLSSFAAKPPLDHSVYDGWKSVSRLLVENDGDWAQWTVAPQEGDLVLHLYNVKTGKTYDIERATLAKHDAVWSFGTVADAFSKSFGMEISPTNTPKIWKVLENSLLTTDQMRVAPKAFFHRRRPFAYFNEEPLCPKEDGIWRDEGSYPSGHTLRSMVAALVLAEINPVKANEIFVRAMQYGENRVIAGAHWQSDVDMTRLAAAIAYSRLQTIPAFRSQMEQAKGEFAAMRTAACR